MDRVGWWLALDVQLENNIVIINIIPKHTVEETHTSLFLWQRMMVRVELGANRYRIMVDKYVLCMFPQGKICYSNRT